MKLLNGLVIGEKCRATFTLLLLGLTTLGTLAVAQEQPFVYTPVPSDIANASNLRIIAADAHGQRLASYTLPDGRLHYRHVDGLALESRELILPPQLLQLNGLGGR